MTCAAGIIIDYKVNDSEIVGFHVMFDDGTTMTMKSQMNTINNIYWCTKEVYIKASGADSDYMTTGNNKGSLILLPHLRKNNGRMG